MPQPYMSQIEPFPYDYTPHGWMLCDGKLLAIGQYQALFSLLGTKYGGDGQHTFGLPDLRGRVAIGFGQGQGLSNYIPGQATGSEGQVLGPQHMPPGQHDHTLSVSNANTGGTNQPSPSVSLAACYSQTGSGTPTPVVLYGTGPATVPMAGLASTGGQPHSNLMPTLALNYCICVQGIFPRPG